MICILSVVLLATKLSNLVTILLWISSNVATRMKTIFPALFLTAVSMHYFVQQKVWRTWPQMPAMSHPVCVLQHLGPSFPHCYCYGHNPISSGPAKRGQHSENIACKANRRKSWRGRLCLWHATFRFNRKTSRPEIHPINESASISSTVPVAIEWRPFLSILLYRSKMYRLS